MKSTKCSVILRQLIRIFIGFALAVSLSACSTTPAQLHNFGYDVFPNSGAELLDWRYGSGSTDYRRANPADAARGKINSSVNFGGFMEVGDCLYVKWRSIETGQVFEQTVDLRQKLPRNMTSHMIYFEIERQRLMVYLKTPVLRGKDQPAVGPSLYEPYVVVRLHPKP